MISRQKAHALRAMIEKAAAGLDDRDASMAAELFPRLKRDGSLIAAFTRVNWNGAVMAAQADLWDTEPNDPDHAPNLWKALAYRDGIRIIPEVIYLAEAFSAGERGWWGDTVYVSLVDNNVYTPAQYAQNWEAEV